MGPCIPGSRRLFVNINGDFYPCERVSETSPRMKIGSLEQGFEVRNMKYLLNGSDILKEKVHELLEFKTMFHLYWRVR